MSVPALPWGVPTGVSVVLHPCSLPVQGAAEYACSVKSHLPCFNVACVRVVGSEGRAAPCSAHLLSPLLHLSPLFGRVGDSLLSIPHPGGGR